MVAQVLDRFDTAGCAECVEEFSHVRRIAASEFQRELTLDLLIEHRASPSEQFANALRLGLEQHGGAHDRSDRVMEDEALLDDCRDANRARTRGRGWREQMSDLVELPGGG